jgi:hypothetical protein
MVMDSKQSSSSGMRFSEGRLKGIDMIKREKSQWRFDNLLNQLRKIVQMGYRPIAKEVFFYLD